MTSHRPPDWRPLAALAAIVTLLAAFGVLPRWPGLLHLVALPPLDLTADLRLLLTRAPGYPSFVIGVVSSLAIRTLVLAALLGAIDRAGLARSLRYLAALWPIAFVAAAALYAAPAVLFYLLFWIGLAVTLLLVGVGAAAPWTEAQAVRRSFVAAAGQGFRLGTVLAYLAGLTVLGGLADATPTASVGLVPVSAALTWLVATVLHEPERLRTIRRIVAAAPAAALVALVAVAMTGPAGPPRVPPPEDPRDGSLLLMSGIDSSSRTGAILEIDPAVIGFTCDDTYKYSYEGPGEGQPAGQGICASATGAPYEREDTLRSREHLIPAFAEQLEEIPPPVVAMVHSQGVWLGWQAAVTGRAPGLATLVLVGPFPQNPVAFPVEGGGPGSVGADVVRITELLGRPGGTSVFEVDSPLVREWLAHPDAIETILARPLPNDVAALTVPSVFDLPLMPDGPGIDGATGACPVPVIHPNLPYSGEFLDAVDRFLDDRPLPSCPWWRTLVGPALRHFSIPPVR